MRDFFWPLFPATKHFICDSDKSKNGYPFFCCKLDFEFFIFYCMRPHNYFHSILNLNISQSTISFLFSLFGSYENRKKMWDLFSEFQFLTAKNTRSVNRVRI